MEKDLQKKCIEYARGNGFFIYSINPPNYKRMTFGTVFGMPDLHIVDLNVFVELKAGEYKNTHKTRQEKQSSTREKLEAHGAKCYKVSTLDEFINILK
jgi:hypothetical protein